MTSPNTNASTTAVTSSRFLTGSQELRESPSPSVQQNIQAADKVNQESLIELEELRSLGPNWDSYGGEPPTAQALISGENLLQSAQMILGKYVGSRLEPEYIAPRADGGIQIEWGHRPAKVSVSVTPQGGFAYLAVSWENGVREPREKHAVSLDDVIQEIARVVFES